MQKSGKVKNKKKAMMITITKLYYIVLFEFYNDCNTKFLLPDYC